MKKHRGIVLARVSSKDQATKGYSLSSQVRLLDEYSEKNEINIIEKFIIPESASGKLERKLFTKALEFIKTNPTIKIILCEKVDRLTRNFKDALKINEWLEADEDRSIHFVKQNLAIHKHSKAHEKFQWDIHVVLARQYTNNLSEEVIKGLYEKAESGWYPGNNKRGYKLIGEKGKRTWAIDNSESSDASFIKKAFEMYDSGDFTIDDIRHILFDEGWANLHGKPISKSVLHGLLRDCFYCGEFIWKKRHYVDNVQHAPLISKDLFYRVQKRIHRQITGKYRKNNFVFGTLIKCGECGYSIIGEIQKSHKYYHCSRHDKTCTQRTYIREEHLEEQLINEIHGLKIKDIKIEKWLRATLKENHNSKKEYHNTTMAKLKNQYSIIERRLEVLYDDKADGHIPLRLYKQKLEQYMEELNNIEKAIQKHKQANFDYYEFSLNIFEISQSGLDIYNKSNSQKRKLLKFIFSEITLKNKVLEFEYKNGFQFIFNRSKINDWLGITNDFRTANWANITQFPEVDIAESGMLLTA